MKPFMTKTLAIALLAGSTFSVVPAIAQSQAPAGGQAGADATTPIIPRQGQMQGQQTQGSGAVQGQIQGQGQVQKKDMGQAQDSGSDKGSLKAQGGTQGQGNGQRTAPQSDSAQQKPAGQADPSSAANTDKSRSPAATNDTARQNNGQNNSMPNQSGDQAKTDRPSNEITGSVSISTQQKTELHQVFVQEKAKPVNIDVQVSVGTAIPRTVELRPLPSRIVEIVPAYRGYEYFVMADGRIIIVKPATHEVVYILAG